MRFSSWPGATNTPRAFCHRFNYATRIPAGTVFPAGGALTFNVTSLNAVNSDLWLYRTTTGFGNGNNIVHGLDYAPTLDTNPLRPTWRFPRYSEVGIVPQAFPKVNQD